MKLFKALFAVSLIIIGIQACQKELSFDGTSIGILKKDSGGDCLPVTVNGVFQVDTVIVANANYVDVEVLVSIPGTFDVKSDTINGYSFSKAGAVGSGLNVIRLYASGKPIAAGNNTFTIKYGSSQCTFTITVVGASVGAATYTLGGSPGSCSGAVVNGLYTQGAALTAANTVTLQVNVTAVGTYNLGAASINGMVFTGSGVFTSTGVQTITLSGIGIPVAAGIFNATATNGTSSCTFSITVLPAGGGAVFTLNGAPGSCSGAVVNGTYTAGTTLTATNTVTLQVTVTTIGPYTISTNTVNGISFIKTGIFTVTGPQPVTLNGTGTPAAAGTFNFNATAGTSICIFSVTCVPPPPNLDYFPLTANSWWTYNSDYTAPDSLFKVSTIQSVKAGNTYRRFNLGAGPTGVTVGDSTFYRKLGNDYYHYINVDTFASFYYDVPQRTEIIFLKENATVGTTWTSVDFTGASGGISTVLRYSFTIAATGSTLIVNGVTYNNVIRVDWKAMENVNGAGFTDEVLYQSYYAQGIGLIKYVQDYQAVAGVEDTDNLRNYMVY